MRTEEQVRAERQRLQDRASRYERQGRAQEAADMDSDAAMLSWVLEEQA